MRNQQQFDRFAEKYPHSHEFFFARPYRTRRSFFRLLGAGLTAATLAENPAFGQVIKSQGVPTLNKARNVVFILLTGAPSHTDTFDFKPSPDSPMDLLKPDKIGQITWPTGLMGKLANNLGDMVIVRSVRSWALQHNLAQTWTQIGRSPAAALGDIAPNIGSIVAAELLAQRTASQVFPTFLALNSDAAVGSGYMPTTYAPLRVLPDTRGLPDTTNPDGAARFDQKWNLMQTLDGGLRANNVYGKDMMDYGNFYTEGRGLMYNPTVDNGFRFTTDESQRYGNTGFGNACLLTSKVLAARAGTRYVMISLGSWDHHNNIYAANSLPAMTRTLDNGLSQMINDMKASGVFQETLIVVQGEFGRTVGRLTSQAGRDHYLQQFAVFAGAGVKGGRAIGATDATGGATSESGWSRQRDIRPEDIEATIYSALGIDYTSVRYDDPFGRGFYYVPESNQDVYGPINELWG